MTKSHFALGLIGALIGGFPGAVLAFFIAAGTGKGGLTGEAICCLSTLVFSGAGAFIGILFAKAIRGEHRIRADDVTLPAVLGVICGLTGYALFYWVISHADPPL
jgi:hypothetical protein